MKEIAFLLLMNVSQTAPIAHLVPLKLYDTLDQCTNDAGHIYIESLKMMTERWKELEFPEMKYFCAVVPADYKL